MKTPLCEKFGIDYPIFGFTPSAEVAAAISRAGGLGVLGCVRFNEAEELDEVLEWMHENTDGKPFGVDVVMPAKIPTEGSKVDLDTMIPPEHRAFVERTLDDLGVPPLPDGGDRVNTGVLGWLHSVARSHVDIAMEHKRKYGQIKLIANALGSPPQDVIDLAHENGVAVAALAGAKEHALHHVDAGVDIVIAQGYEGGGHTGEVTSMILWPELVDAVGDHPVLAAGGVGSGRQIAAAIALGAQGVWMGTYWLTAAEYRLGAHGDGPTTVQQALLAATSRDTVRRRIYS
ncbi:MAG: nitronate monooxygenase, partial [Gordonia sp. (in: high G+C Gram-positive bacteria)]